MIDKRLTGFRYVNTLRGDTLQRIAARELGDASRWVDLANINRLAPPYLTDDVLQADDRCLLTGSQIMVPSAGTATIDSAVTDPHGSDVLLRQGRLHVADGDISLVSGVDNYAQALRHLVATEPGDLLFHPRYGCGVRSLLGASNSRARMMLAGSRVRQAVAADPRTHEVSQAAVDVRGDALYVRVHAIATHHSPVKLEVLL